MNKEIAQRKCSSKRLCVRGCVNPNMGKLKLWHNWTFYGRNKYDRLTLTIRNQYLQSSSGGTCHTFEKIVDGCLVGPSNNSTWSRLSILIKFRLTFAQDRELDSSWWSRDDPAFFWDRHHSFFQIGLQLRSENLKLIFSWPDWLTFDL